MLLRILWYSSEGTEGRRRVGRSELYREFAAERLVSCPNWHQPIPRGPFPLRGYVHCLDQLGSLHIGTSDVRQLLCIIHSPV